MPKYIDVDSSAYGYGTLADWLISSVGPEPPVWTEPHIDELIEDFYVVPKSAPLADVVEVRHGRWIWELADNGWANHICSECGYTKNTDIHVRLGYYYCPICGAKMDGWQEDA